MKKRFVICRLENVSININDKIIETLVSVEVNSFTTFKEAENCIETYLEEEQHFNEQNEYEIKTVYSN